MRNTEARLIAIKIDNDLICYAVNKYSDTIFRITFSHTQNTADTEDITQETFLALMNKRPVIENETHLKAWLIHVAVNKCRDLFKSAARRKTAALETAAAKYKLNDDDIDVIKAVNKLSPLERSIVFLHYFEGYTVKEIGDIIGKKENAVFKRLERTRIKLKDILRD